jgi:hypothetical protein
MVILPSLAGETGLSSSGCCFPFNRAVTFMSLFEKDGVLGEYPRRNVQKLQDEIKKWQAADSTVTVQPALQNI